MQAFFCVHLLLALLFLTDHGCIDQLAVEISSEPSVREYVRTFYSKDAVVTTKPTPVGIDAIDSFHQFEGVKWINEKPISAFDDEQWLLIQKAEEEKLIDVTVGLPKESVENILFKCEQLFLSDGVSCASQSWNEQRKQILQEAVVKLLLPIMEKETRMSLVTRAKQLLVAKCGLQLWNKVSVAPYDPASGNDMHCRCVNLLVSFVRFYFVFIPEKHECLMSVLGVKSFEWVAVFVFYWWYILY